MSHFCMSPVANKKLSHDIAELPAVAQRASWPLPWHTSPQPSPGRASPAHASSSLMCDHDLGGLPRPPLRISGYASPRAHPSPPPSRAHTPLGGSLHVPAAHRYPCVGAVGSSPLLRTPSLHAHRHRCALRRCLLVIGRRHMQRRRHVPRTASSSMKSEPSLHARSRRLRPRPTPRRATRRGRPSFRGPLLAHRLLAHRLLAHRLVGGVVCTSPGSNG